MKVSGTYLVHDTDGTLVSFRNVAAICRHAQGRHLAELVVWRSDRERGEFEPMLLARYDDATWRLLAAGTLVCEHAATLTDDRRVLDAITYLEELLGGCEIVLVPPGLWDLGVPAGLAERRLHRMGFHDVTYRLRTEAADPFYRWEFCPEILADCAAGLSDTDFGYYLNYVALRTKIRMLEMDAEPDAFERRVEAAIAGYGAAYETVVSRVEEAALGR